MTAVASRPPLVSTVWRVLVILSLNDGSVRRLDKGTRNCFRYWLSDTVTDVLSADKASNPASNTCKRNKLAVYQTNALMFQQPKLNNSSKYVHKSQVH